MSRTVCILYGVNEGPAMGKRLAAALRQSGFDVVRKPGAADIIFAHSGGCFLVPSENHAKLVVMAGLPYWPKRPLAVSTSIKAWRDWKLNRQRHTLRRWATKWVYHSIYAWDLKNAGRMAANPGPNKPWNSSKHQLILRNRDDAYCSPEVLHLPFKGPRTFVSMPGEHDDCWDNPERYVQLLQSLTEGKL